MDSPGRTPDGHCAPSTPATWSGSFWAVANPRTDSSKPATEPPPVTIKTRIFYFLGSDSDNVVRQLTQQSSIIGVYSTEEKKTVARISYLTNALGKQHTAPYFAVSGFPQNKFEADRLMRNFGETVGHLLIHWGDLEWDQ
eukprot:gene19958-1022_t